MMTMARTEESTTGTSVAPVLLLAFELGERTWKLGFSTGVGQQPRVRHIPAGTTERARQEIARAKVRFRLPTAVAVGSCYEAGRDGFWLHRWLEAQAVTNHVIESSSLEVNRRARRAKTDRLDLIGLLRLLARAQQGDRRGWRAVRVPRRDEEDARQLHRTRETVQQDRHRLINRLKALLATQGLKLPLTADFLTQLETTPLWDGAPIPAGLKARLRRGWAQLAFLNRTLDELDAERATLTPDPETPMGRYVHGLPTLRGIGPVGTWTLATEIVGWRQIQNRRQLGGLVGLVPAPYQSGESAHDQGITRAGNKHVRRLMVQLAWSWVRYQPRQPPHGVVSAQVRTRQSSIAAHWDRRAGAQATHCPLAICGTRGNPRGGHCESGLSITTSSGACEARTSQLVRVSALHPGSREEPT